MSAAPLAHPQTQGKIERWHPDAQEPASLLEHYYLPGDLERQVAAFVARHNSCPLSRDLDNLTRP